MNKLLYKKKESKVHTRKPCIREKITIVWRTQKQKTVKVYIVSIYINVYRYAYENASTIFYMFEHKFICRRDCKITCIRIEIVKEKS